MSDYFEDWMKAGRKRNKQALNQIVYRMAAEGEGISPLSRLLGAISMLTMGVLLVFLIKDGFRVSFVILLLSQLVFSLKQFRFRTRSFGYLFTLGFLIYFAYARYWTGFGLIIIHLCLNSAMVALQIKNVRKSIRNEEKI